VLFAVELRPLLTATECLATTVSHITTRIATAGTTIDIGTGTGTGDRFIGEDGTTVLIGDGVTGVTATEDTGKLL